MHDSLLSRLQFSQADHYTLPLVRRFYKANGMRGQAARDDIVYIARLDSRIVAALRLQPVKEGVLLRSMCVDASLRQQGIGSSLLDYIQPQLSQVTCYCFPFDHLEPFYHAASFRLIDPALAPPSINERFTRYINSGKRIYLMKHCPPPC